MARGLQIVCAALVVAVALAGYPHAKAQCRPYKQRCAGAPGKPRVEWINCCGGLVCVNAPDKMGLGYGRHCLKPAEKKKVEGEKECRDGGERCMGAPGHDYIPWKRCCPGYKCIEKPGDWGKFCMPDGSKPTDKTKPKMTEAPKTVAPKKEMSDYEKEKKVIEKEYEKEFEKDFEKEFEKEFEREYPSYGYKAQAPTCRGENKRCHKGSHTSFKCCSGYTCKSRYVRNGYYISWGEYCVKDVAKTKPTMAKPVTTKAPVKAKPTTTVGPYKYYKAPGQVMPKATQAPKTTKAPEVKPRKVYPTAQTKCASEEAKCSKDSDCCGGLECKPTHKYYGVWFGHRCVAKEEPAKEEPAKCIAKGKKCLPWVSRNYGYSYGYSQTGSGGASKCCDGLSCLPGKGGFGYVCKEEEKCVPKFNICDTDKDVCCDGFVCTPFGSFGISLCIPDVSPTASPEPYQ